MEPLRFNNLEVRLAGSDAALAAAQALRYRIFYDEMGAKPTALVKRLGRDADPYDDYCDHLLVIDRERGSAANPCVVGTYRMLRGDVAKATSGFYSEGEFDLGALLTYPGEIMELGRSCIDSAYRRRGAMQLLWAGIAEYIALHEVQVMFGCGSLHGTDPREIGRSLAYLHHFHAAPGYLRPRAIDRRYVPMDTMDKDAIDTDKALAELPPLLKGYLRLGGFVGDGAVIDHQFNTIDVCIVVETVKLAGTYSRHFVRDKAAANRSRISTQ